MEEPRPDETFWLAWRPEHMGEALKWWRNRLDRPLLPGMVLTIEPGLYIAPDAEVDGQWRGIGIRIEDNLLVTASGHQLLTAAAPKSVAEIEALMQGDQFQ